MKKRIALLLAFICILSLAACGTTLASTGSSTADENSTIKGSDTNALGASDESTQSATEITLTIGNIVLDAYLNDSIPAHSLVEQLPLTVTLNDSDNDFCGDHLDISYSENDVTSGYRNGDLVFWPSANNFVIFVSDEENSAGISNLVHLGHITSPQAMLNALKGTIQVTIALKENAAPNGTEKENTEDIEMNPSKEALQIKITIGDTELFATLQDNATTRAWMDEMPMTLSMLDLYGREMCYRYGGGTFPTDNLQYDGYAVGDIAYWPPRGSLVILYEQNGEQFERQHIGHIDSGVDIFSGMGNTEVTFEVVSD